MTQPKRKGNGVAILALHELPSLDKVLEEGRLQTEAGGSTTLNRSNPDAEAFPAQAAYDRKPAITVTPHDTAYDAATNIIAAHIAVARAIEGGIIADHDIRFLHDYRVAVRKVRSVLCLFKGVYDEDLTADLETNFRDLMAPTSHLRDLDVYLAEKQRYFDLLPKTLHGGLDTMFGMYAAERTIAKAHLSRHLESKAYEKEISDLARLFKKRRKLTAGPKANLRARDYACDLVWRRYQKICKIADEIGLETDNREVHKLRIHCKKLRYLMEFFGPLFPKPDIKALLKPLKHVQDNLGLHNDYSVQQASLNDFLWGRKNWPDGVDIDVAQSVGALTAVLHVRQLGERRKVVDSFAQFNSPETQKMFRHLFRKPHSKR